jgi:hypothetical protein
MTEAATLAAVAAATAATFPIRFNQHAVTNGTHKARVHYELDNRCDGRRCVTIYAKDYGTALGVILGAAYENNTDVMTDYFDKGRAVLFDGQPLYAEARARVAAFKAARAAKGAA